MVFVLASTVSVVKPYVPIQRVNVPQDVDLKFKVGSGLS